MEKKKGDSGKLKSRFFIRESLFVFELINMHDLLAKNQRTKTGKNCWAMKAEELDTYSAISCQRGAKAYYFDSMNQQMNTVLIFSQPIKKQRICFPNKF